MLVKATDLARFPIPEHNVSFAISAANPFSIRREADLTGVPGNGVTSESLLSVLSKIIRAVNQNLVVQ